MKHITITITALIFNLFTIVEMNAQSPACGINSPVLTNRDFEYNPCPQCETCKMPENMPMAEIENNFNAKPDTAKVFGPIKKSELSITIDHRGHANDAPSANTLKSLASHMDDYMDLEAMLECINVNCFFTHELMTGKTLNEVNDSLVKQGKPPITTEQYNYATSWPTYFNIDSIAGSYFCVNNPIINSLRADSVICSYTWDGPCTGDPLNQGETLSLREDALGYDMAELDLFSSQLQGLEMAGKFANVTSPDLQKMTSMVNAGVNLFNGLPTIGLDLMTLTALDLSTSISVSNDGKGVKVNDFCGDLGMNWNLNAGGMISRNMNGLPDEFFGESRGIGMGPAPIIKPCGKLAGGGMSYYDPVSVLYWQWSQPNVLHIRPTIASFLVYGVLVYINLDFTVEINLRYIPDTIEYIEKGVGYLNANNSSKMNSVFGSHKTYNTNDFIDVYTPNQNPNENALNKLHFIRGIHGANQINDFQFMSPKLAQIMGFMKGIYNLFDNVKEESKRLDYEQDEFYYNFDGHAGKFIINQDRNVYLMPHDNLIVTPIFAEIDGVEHIASFTIQTLDGKLYEFGRSDGTGVDFTTRTNYVLPNYYTYPAADSTNMRMSAAQLQETSLPFQGAVFCYPSALEYAATYENSFTIKNSPRYSSGWHLLSIKSLLTQEEINLEYEKDTLDYYTNKNLTHDFPNFETDGDEFLTQGRAYPGGPLAEWFVKFINLTDTVATEWRFGRASFIYTATENKEVRHRLAKIKGNVGEEVVFDYSDETCDIVGKKYLKSIHHLIDGNFNKGWEFEKDDNPPAPVDFKCIPNKIGGPSVSADGEFGFNLGRKREKTDYPYLELKYFNLFDYIVIPIELPYKIILKNLPHHEQMTEFGSLVQVKQLFNPNDIIQDEARIFAAEKNRKFLKNIYEIGRDESLTSILKVEYEGEDKLSTIPKRFSMQQDLWGYYNTNPSGSLLPRMKYLSFSGQPKEAVASHYGFSSMDEEYDVTLGHNEAMDIAKCKYGLVKSVQIETGGKLVYEYEPNKWPVAGGYIDGAGMRVKSLMQNSGHKYGGTKFISYEYEQPFILNSPVRIFANPNALSDYDYLNPVHFERMIKTSSQPMNEWDMCQSNYVGYGKVTERYKGNGHVDHFFKNIEMDYDGVPQYIREETAYLISLQASKSEIYNYPIFNNYHPKDPQYIGLADSILTFDQSENLIEKNLYSYVTVSGNCGEVLSERGERALCRLNKLKIDQVQQNYPGEFQQSKDFQVIFNMVRPILGEVGIIIGYIQTMASLVHPFRRIVRHTVYNLQDLSRYSKSAKISETKTFRYFDDGSHNMVTHSTIYSNSVSGSSFVLFNTKAQIPLEEITTYQGGRTINQKYFYPQNSTHTDLKMTESAFDFLKNNKIFIPIKTQTESGTNIIAGSISPLKAYSGAYHTHELWSIKQGAWVLDGTYIDYSNGMPTQYKVACYPIPNASDYSPIDLVWAGNRTLTSRTYETRTETYLYTGLRELQHKTNGDGVYDTYVYDARGRIAVVGSLNGRQNTSYQYDFSHIPNKITTTRSYNDILIPDQVFVEQFDGFGKSIFKKRNAIRLSEAKYDGMFRPIYTFDIVSGATYNTYKQSIIGELTTMEDGLGNTTYYIYKGRDAAIPSSYSVSQVIDPNGGGLTTVKDGLGNTLKTISALGAETTYDYDPYLRLVNIGNPVGEHFRYEYNAMDKVIASTVPTQLGVNKKWYDEKYRLAAMEDANGNKYVHNYDIHNKLLGTAKVDDGTTFPSQGMMTSADANSHYASGLKVLEHTFFAGKSWLQKKEEQVFRPTATTSLKKITEALTIDDIGRIKELKMTYPNGDVVNIKTQYNNANLVTKVDNLYLTVGFGNYTDKVETTYDDELRPWKTYFTSDLSARRLISQIKYDDRDRMITKWLDEDELQEINYAYDYSSKLIAINAPLTTECQEGQEVCDYELKVTKVSGGPYNKIQFGANQEYPIIPFWDILNPQQTVYFLNAALNYYNLGGVVTFEGIPNQNNEYYEITYKIKNTNAEYIRILSYDIPAFEFSKGDCCHLAPNDQGDGPQGPGPTPEGGAYDNPDLFAEEISYDGLNIDRITLYNACDISSYINQYTYNLDHMVSGVANRIIKADGTLVNNAYSEGMTYDLAGNLLTMQRKAIVNHTSNTVATIDNLTYYPGITSSQLDRVTDSAPGPHQTRGLKPAVSTYDYDDAGNIISDGGKNIRIQYNPIMLPKRFQTPDGDVDVHYTYGGEKIYTVDNRVQPIPVGGHLPIQRWYIGALEIENGFRKIHHHPEGRISVDSLTQDTLFEYVIRDHLGNTAVTFSDMNKNHKVTSSEVLQRDYYYAFGLEIDGNWDNTSSPVRNAYLYNGKEHHNWNGLNWQDYGARWYMPEVGRFTGVDPIAPATPQWSPYAYCGNDPVSFVDPTGGFRTKISAWTYAKLNGGTAYFNSELGEYAVDKYRTSFTGEGSAAMFEYTLISRNTGYSSGKKSLVGHWVKSTFDGINKLLRKMPTGATNNFEEKGQSHVGEGIEVLSNTSLPGNGTVGTNIGSASSIIETGDMLIPAEGGILGTAASKAGGVANALYNVGQGLNSATDGVKSIGNTPKDTIIENVNKNGRRTYTHYNAQDFKEKGDHKNK